MDGQLDSNENTSYTAVIGHHYSLQGGGGLVPSQIDVTVATSGESNLEAVLGYESELDGWDGLPAEGVAGATPNCGTARNCGTALNCGTARNCGTALNCGTARNC